jgi:hypothetical protein
MTLSPLRMLFTTWLTLAFAMAATPAARAEPFAAALHASYEQKSEALAKSPLKRRLLLSSAELPNGLQGEVHAVVDHPLAAVRAAFNGPAHWCEVLLLHINNRRCAVGSAGGQQRVTLGIVRKYDIPVEQAFDLPFVFRVTHADPDYLQVQLQADDGPLGTSNYHILLEATAIDAHRSFLHFAYSYEQNPVVALAIGAYLATFGSDKVGFTELGRRADGTPDYIAGPRGLVERNAMRYFLTLEAYLDTGDSDARRQAWYSATERYPRQLHELDRETYMALKRADAKRSTPP